MKENNFHLTPSQKVGKEKLEAFLDSSERIFLFTGKPGVGKAQPLNSKIQTPFGEKILSSLNINDEVFTRKGDVSNITGIFPQGKRDVYKIDFSDGTSAYSDIEHIWNVRATSGNAKASGFKNMTLKEIIKKGVLYKSPRDIKNKYEGHSKWEIPVCQPVKNYKKNFIIDPYVLGVLIGDGSLVGNVPLISNPFSDKEIIEKVSSIVEKEGFKITLIQRKSKKACPQYMISKGLNEEGFIRRIKYLKLDVLSKEKFIPSIYFLGSLEQRLELLRGLMDTDGSCCLKNKSTFYTSSFKLCEDVMYLIRSLGGVCSSSFFERNGVMEYKISMRNKFNPFFLKRKSRNYKLKNISKTIRKVSFHRNEEVACIMIRDLEHLYLTNDFIVTHNTTLNKITLKEHIQADIDSNSSGYDINIAGITLSHQAKNVLGEHIPNVFTFAKAYGMKEVIDEVTGARSFEIDQYNKDIIVGRCAVPVFVHDEVSQYTPEMIRIVLEQTPVFSKIIFMGDKAQLPPIDPEGLMEVDADSPIFDLEIPESCKHELTERVRQAEGNPILELSDVIREEIFAEQPNIKRVLDIIKVPDMTDGIGYDFVTYNDLLNHIKDKDYLKTALIGFRRKKCINKWNPIIRNFILNSPYDIIVENDVICMTDNYYSLDDTGRPYCVFNNSDVFVIKKVTTYKHRYIIGNKTYYIDCFKAKTSFKPNEFFVTPTTNGEIDFQKALSEVADLCNAKKLYWKQFWDFKKFFCRWTYAYAITAYKCQGSTYDTVYVDINDILLTLPLTPKRKLQTIYTAITRAKNDVWFLKGNVTK